MTWPHLLRIGRQASEGLRGHGHASPLLIIAGVVVAIWHGSGFFVTLESCLGVLFRLPPPMPTIIGLTPAVT